MASVRALFDTSVLVPWFFEEPQFKLPVKKALADLRRKQAIKYLSTVTVQELEVGARYLGGDRLDKVRQYLSAHFAPPLVLDHTTAKLAAQLAAATPRKIGSSASERREITNTWHRDASIAATAHHHGLDYIVTANVKDFQPLMEHLSCELIRVIAI